MKVAGDLWESASVEGAPDSDAAREMVDSLAQAVAQNRTALLSLTALKNYDNYTFTHMVNVSILTMGQARGVGIDGAAAREFGMAALMHDIGKVHTPNEILNKPGKLTDEEFDDPETAHRRRRRNPQKDAGDADPRADRGVRAPPPRRWHRLPDAVRPQLNLGTSLAGIADVYDAMRSQRVYHPAFPTDRILVVLQRNDGAQFDQHLVRRFVQLVGIYPAGNMVQLDTGEVAVVLEAYAPDPYRPQVRILFGADRKPLLQPQDVNLWEEAGDDTDALDPGAGRPGRLRNRPTHSSMTLRRIPLVLAFGLVVLTCGIHAQGAPRLVVMLVVDQMRADYLQTFDRHWHGGIRTLLTEGLVFENARYPYLNTLTCAGHSTIGTGTLPHTHGMVANAWWDRDVHRIVGCTNDPATPDITTAARRGKATARKPCSSRRSPTSCVPKSWCPGRVVVAEGQKCNRARGPRRRCRGVVRR